MWRLTIRQKQKHEDMHGAYEIASEVHFEDENQNNLLDLIRYLAECQIPSDTEFAISEVKDDVSRGN